MLKTKRLSTHVGVEVVDLCISALTSEVVEALKVLIARELVVVFRDHDLSPAEQIAFTRLLGPTVIHPLKTHRDPVYPELLALRNDEFNPGRYNDVWHCDVSFSEAPPAIGVLHAKRVTPSRGDTMFCNMYEAYDNLSARLQQTLLEMDAVHCADTEVLTRTPGVTLENLSNYVPTPVAHPVVREHPCSLRPALFVNPYYVRNFVNFSKRESYGLLKYLCSQAVFPENFYRHRWRLGDVLIFDNCASMHYAVHDYGSSMPRLMHRTSVQGETPVGWRRTAPS